MKTHLLIWYRVWTSALSKALLTSILLISVSTVIYSQENTALLCTDGIDNDGDGDIDCDDQECATLGDSGCQICETGSSFADILIDYVSGCPQADLNPEGALGLNDYEDYNDLLRVFLGEGGTIKLGFTDNLIVNSGDAANDVYVFEVGFMVEAMDVALRPVDAFTLDQLTLSGYTDPDGDGFYDLTGIGGAVSAIDIDALLPGYASTELKFDAIALTDVVNDDCWGSTPGADVDAVCALTSVVVDCNGTINGEFILDECGECLDPNDPDFNMSCLDCAGTINGTAEIDDCGLCLEITDPDFDISCLDCAGVINGTMVLDECGICLEPTDPNFNMSCLDCAGTINGTAEIDLCGDCLDPTDPLFNLACSDCAGEVNGPLVLDTCDQCLDILDPLFNLSCVEFPDLYIPNAFTPNGDGLNDVFQVYGSGGVSALTHYTLYNRWGDQVYSRDNIDLSSYDNWWDGSYRGSAQDVQVFVYIIEATFINGKTRQYSGDVLLLK